MEDGRKDIHWSPRVTKWKLRHLYQRVAEGIWDEDLINDVGMILYMRCRDILVIHRARTRREVTCPRCGNAGRTALVPRTGGRDSLLSCPECGWELTWRRYHRSFQRRQLNPGGAVEGFEGFMQRFRSTKGPKDRMLAIDRVIHEFHYSLKKEPDQPTRAAGVNLISGDLTDVVTFLDELGSMDLPARFWETHAAWERSQEETYWPHILEEKRRRERVVREAPD